MQLGIQTGLAAARICTVVLLGTLLSCSSTTSGENRPEATSSTRIVIDGHTRTVEGKVVCTTGPTGEVTIEVDAADTPDPVVMLDLTPLGDAPSVSLLTINLPDIGLSAGRYRNSGVPVAAKAGNTYTVQGQATVVGTPPERPVYKPFELEVSCGS